MSVRVTAPGHPSVVQEVDVRSDRIVFLQVIVPSFAAVLSELLVSVPGNESVARLVTEAAQLTAADLLAIKVPSTRGTTGNIGKNDKEIRLRGYGSFTQDLQPLVIIDGVRVSGRDGARRPEPDPRLRRGRHSGSTGPHRCIPLPVRRERRR